MNNGADLRLHRGLGNVMFTRFDIIKKTTTKSSSLMTVSIDGCKDTDVTATTLSPISWKEIKNA